MVSILVFSYRFILFIMIAILPSFLVTRIKKYPPSVRNTLLLAVFFSGIACFGRLIDIIALFFDFPFYEEIHIATHIIGIGGLIWAFISLLITLERYYLPLTSSREIQGKTTGKNGFEAGAYIVFSKNRLFDVMELIKNVELPALILTRSPSFYQSMKKNNLKIVWITQVPDKGVSPTALHVLGDIVIKFIKDNPRSVVLIDSIEYLSLYNDFKAVFKFLVNLKDRITLMNSTLIIFVDKATLEEWQEALLLKEFEPL